MTSSLLYAHAIPCGNRPAAAYYDQIFPIQRTFYRTTVVILFQNADIHALRHGLDAKNALHFPNNKDKMPVLVLSYRAV